MQRVPPPQKADYLEKFLRKSPVFYAFLRAIECRHMSTVALEPPVLDLGCGDGMFGSILFDERAGAVDYGIDISLKEIMKARKTGVYQLLQVADILHLPFADDSIGSIFSNSVFEHLDDIDAALSEAVRVLMPGGKLVLTSPNERLVDNFIIARIFRSLGMRSVARVFGDLGNRALGNRTCLSNEQWKEKAANAGFGSAECSNLIPPKIFHISEIFMPLGAFSVPSKRLFGRLLLTERRLSLKPFHSILNNPYKYGENSDGLATMIVAVK